MRSLRRTPAHTPRARLLAAARFRAGRTPLAWQILSTPDESPMSLLLVATSSAQEGSKGGNSRSRSASERSSQRPHAVPCMPHGPAGTRPSSRSACERTAQRGGRDNRRQKRSINRCLVVTVAHKARSLRGKPIELSGERSQRIVGYRSLGHERKSGWEQVIGRAD